MRTTQENTQAAIASAVEKAKIYFGSRWGHYEVWEASDSEVTIRAWDNSDEDDNEYKFFTCPISTESEIKITVKDGLWGKILTAETDSASIPNELYIKAGEMHGITEGRARACFPSSSGYDDARKVWKHSLSI